MKKFTLGALVALAALSLGSCGNSTPKADLKDDLDSLSYAIGMAQSNGLSQYLVERMGVDSTYVDEFIKGLNEGVNAGDKRRRQLTMLVFRLVSRSLHRWLRASTTRSSVRILQRLSLSRTSWLVSSVAILARTAP